MDIGKQASLTKKNKKKTTRPRVPGNPIHGADPGVYSISITELHYRHINQLRLPSYHQAKQTAQL